MVWFLTVSRTLRAPPGTLHTEESAMNFVGLLLCVAAIAVGLWFVFSRSKAGDSSTATTPARRGPATSPAAAVTADPNVAKANWLIGIGGPVEGKNFHVGARTVTLGRGPQNFIQIDDGLTSRRHCQVCPHDGWLEVIDMASENGVFVNEEQVTNGRLNDGDELRVGTGILVYQSSANRLDDALRSRKNAGKETVQATEAAPNFAVVMKALDASGGDIELAARHLNMKPDLLRSLVKSMGGG